MMGTFECHDPVIWNRLKKSESSGRGSSGKITNRCRNNQKF